MLGGEMIVAVSSAGGRQMRVSVSQHHLLGAQRQASDSCLSRLSSVFPISASLQRLLGALVARNK